jgi:hypothetical protein
MSALRASIIVNTLDRVDHLTNALMALEQVREPSFELIIVNGPSTDRTEALLDRYAGRLKHGTCAAANLAQSRNTGLGLAAGDVVAFLDDDAVPHPRWLAALLARLTKDDLAAVGGYTIGDGGARFQTRKILCDRFGGAHMVSDFLDESALCQPGSWLFPAPMGTNVLFRRDALERIGGFDETFSYFLEETDVCLRLIDAGYRIGFERAAFVFHQFAGSRLRNSAKAPAELRSISRSKSYFVARHGAPGGQPADMVAAASALLTFEQDQRSLIGRLAESGAIDAAHAARLRREITEGLAAGQNDARNAMQRPGGHWRPADAAAAHLSFARSTEEVAPLRIAFVCRSYPPRNEHGIARFTLLAATALARRGHTVHIITEARDGPRLGFDHGLWTHEIVPAAAAHDEVSERFGLPAPIAAWAEAVRRHVPVLETFGVDVLSFPIWDVEGIGCFDAVPFPVVVTLHTTMAIAIPHHAEWAVRPLHRSDLAQHMVRAERIALDRADLVVANSSAALADIAQTSGALITEKAVVIPHGTPIGSPPSTRMDGPLRLLFVGRAEERKGHDLALQAVTLAIARGVDVTARFVGDTRFAACIAAISSRGRITSDGQVSREDLDRLYAEHDLLLMPSRYESFGLTAIEAMAQGCAVLATAVGGLVEVVDPDVSGSLIPLDEQTPDALADEIARLAADRATLAALRCGAYEAARAQFDVTLMADRIAASFNRIVRPA